MPQGIDETSAGGQLRRLLDMSLHRSQVPVLILDDAGSVVLINQPAKELFGVESQDDVDDQVEEILTAAVDRHGEQIPRLHRPAAQAITTGRSMYSTVLGIDDPATGERRWLLSNAIVRTTANERAEFVLCSFVEIVVNDATEDELWTLSRVAECTDHAVLITDLRFVVQWVNHAYEAITGWSIEELRGKIPAILTDGDGSDDLSRQRLQRRVYEGKDFRGQVLDRTRDGEPIWLDLELKPLLDSAGTHTHWMLAFEDVTHRVSFEVSATELTQKLTDEVDRLRTALRREQHGSGGSQCPETARDAFIRNLGHELLTPIGDVLGSIGLLEGTRLGSEQEELISMIRSSTNRLQHALELMLDYAKLQSGLVSLDGRAIVVSDLLERVRSNNDRRAADLGVGLVVHRPCQDTPILRGDAMRIVRILDQLVGNALGFTRSGSVNLVAEVEEAAAEEEYRLRIRVEDSGVGIPDEARERIFEPFFQLDMSTTRQHQGVGLGLSVSRLLARAMGGDLRCVPSSNGGGCFEFEIPAFEWREDKDA